MCHLPGFSGSSRNSPLFCRHFVGHRLSNRHSIARILAAFDHFHLVPETLQADLVASIRVTPTKNTR
jgi:hypothetical protein